jgi:hypothetical protein
MPFEPHTVVTDDMVLVPVGELDKRAYRAVRRAIEMANGSIRAVHVCSTAEDADGFARQWTRTGMNMSVPLEIIESTDDWARSLRAVVERELGDHTGTIMLVIGRLLLRKQWHRLLHDHSAEQIVDAVADLARVRVELVDVLA